jgi:hypothetical protein
MATLKKLKNAKIETLNGAPGKSVKVDTDGFGESDAELYHSPGILSKPVDDTYGVELDVQGNSIIIATHDYNVDKSLDTGEIFFYSVNASGTILSSALLNKNGEFIINDGARSAAAFDKLKEGFDELKSDVNDLIAKWNAFATAYVPGSPTVQGTPPTAATSSTSTASIDDAEVDEVLLP